MALTLSGIKTAFKTFVSRTDTDDFVSQIIKTSQNSIVSEGFFDWSLDQNNRSQTLVSGTIEYDLKTLNSSWNIRKIKAIWMKDENGARRRKLPQRDLAWVREFYPDPATFPNSSIPEFYYVKDDGKTIGLIPIPDSSTYIIYVDFFTFPADPASNDLVIPEEFELVLLSHLAYLWYNSIQNFEASDRKMVEYRQFLKPLLIKNDQDNTKDVYRTVKPYGTHGGNTNTRRQRYSDSEWDSVAP